MRLGLLKSGSTSVLALMRHARRDSRGVAAVEFAMLVPVLLVMLVGTVEFSQAITVDRRVSQIASSTADLVAREKTITTAEIDNIMRIARVLMEPYDTTRLQITLVNVGANINNAATTKVCWSYNFQGGVTTYAPGQVYALPKNNPTDASSALIDKGGSVMVAEVRYNWTPGIFQGTYGIGSIAITVNPISLEETFYLKPRQSAMIRYNGDPVCVVT